LLIEQAIYALILINNRSIIIQQHQTGNQHGVKSLAWRTVCWFTLLSSWVTGNMRVAG